MAALLFAWEPFISFGQALTLKKNAVLYHQGDIGSGFYYMKQGAAKIKLLSDQGGERTIDYVLSGELLGEQGIEKKPYFTTVVITAPSIVYFFSIEVYHQICGRYPAATEAMMNSVINKVRLLADTVALLSGSAEQQTAHVLYKLFQKHGSTAIPIDQTALAHYVGTSRITIYKIIKKWKQSGLIAMDHHKIYLNNMQVIEQLLYARTSPFARKEGMVVMPISRQGLEGYKMADGWHAYLYLAKRIYLKRNSVIYSQGDVGKGFYYLDSGMVKVVTSGAKGKKRVLDIVGSGHIFGEQAMDGQLYFSTAVAAVDSVIYFFSSEEFYELITAHTKLFHLFMESTIHKIRLLSEAILLKSLDAEQQLAFLLLKLHRISADGFIHFSRQELANYSGLTRITVYKVLKKWAQDNWIDVHSQMIRIKHPKALEKVCSSSNIT